LARDGWTRRTPAAKEQKQTIQGEEGATEMNISTDTKTKIRNALAIGLLLVTLLVTLLSVPPLAPP
jgi:hypothetical protein